MNILDISWPISPDMTAYKNRSLVHFNRRKDVEKDGATETTLTLDTHSGTHVDAPAHFIAKGSTIDEVPLGSLIGESQVIDCQEESVLSADSLRKYAIKEHMILLFKTRNSLKGENDQFEPNFVYLDASGAEYLVAKKIKAVGIDYLGIERSQPQHETHRTFLHAGIPIVEGLRLQHVNAGFYMFYCLPLALRGVEAAPARAILIEQ